MTSALFIYIPRATLARNILFAGVIFAHLLIGCVAQSWKTYPSSINGYPQMSFPGAEANHPSDGSDTWFITARLTGLNSGKEYQLGTIFDRNTVLLNPVILNFYEVSLFDCSNGDYVTYTDYDLPGVNILLGLKLQTSNDHLDLLYHSSAGDATWATAKDPSGALRPFVYDLHLPGNDSFGSGPFSIDITADMQNRPVALGANVLQGSMACFGEPGTFSYFQTGPKINGTITFKGVTEPVQGTLGHLDRQWFPLTPLIYTPTGRQHSHEWRQINLYNGVDLSIWRQFDRTNNNTVIETTGTTAFQDDSSTWTAGLPMDLTVEYIKYKKYPRSSHINTLVPPPSPNMYIATEHIVRSTSLGMELQGTYVQETPAIYLVIEYFEGPIAWNGTYNGESVTGIGIFESTYALYRDWELTEVLYNSLTHLPDASFGSESKSQMLQIVAGLRQYVSSNLLQDNRAMARSYIIGTIIPALQTMSASSDKSNMLAIAADLKFSLTLVLQF
ncbi:hypothetical protein AA313_de0207650 [Arthrobotrys entomopaga]|nr:hypothetical protein AA313_de0207650 [Arthrobotrys entomopaga]